MSARAIQQSGSFLFYWGSHIVVLVHWRDALNAGQWGRSIVKYTTRWGGDLETARLRTIVETHSHDGCNGWEFFQDAVLEELAKQAENPERQEHPL